MAEKYGQHFLQSAPLLERIANLICGDGHPRVVEIGPGRGALTALLLERVANLTAIEIDPELVGYLRSRFGDTPNLELVQGNALTADFAAHRPDVVAGNLPYYVATALIDRTVRLGFPGVFLIQKEVALRMTSGPGSRDYGYLSVATQLFANPKLEFGVPPGAFRPPPRVDSAVVSLTPVARAAEYGVADVDAFLKFLSASFRQKRKTLRNNLRADYPGIEGEPEAQLRAEQIPLPGFAALYLRLIRGLSSS